MRPVLNALDFGFSYLILLSNWEKEANVSLANMPADLSGNVQLETTDVVNGQATRRDVEIPLTAYEIYYLFQFIQLERLRNAAEMEIGRVRGATGESAMPDFSAIIMATRDFRNPQRWRIPEDGFRFVMRPDEEVLRSDLVWGHPKTQAMLTDPEWSAAWLKLNPLDETHRIIMWIVPPITDPDNPTRLIEIIRRRELELHGTERALNDIVEEQLGHPAADDLEWLIALGRAASSEEMVELFRGASRSLLETERESLQAPLGPRFRLLRRTGSPRPGGRTPAAARSLRVQCDNQLECPVHGDRAHRGMVTSNPAGRRAAGAARRPAVSPRGNPLRCVPVRGSFRRYP